MGVWQNNSWIAFVNIPGRSTLHSQVYLQHSSYSFFLSYLPLTSLQTPLSTNSQFIVLIPPPHTHPFYKTLRRQKCKIKQKIMPGGNPDRNSFLPPHANIFLTSATEHELLVEKGTHTVTHTRFIQLNKSHYQPQIAFLKSYKWTYKALRIKDCRSSRHLVRCFAL